MLSTTNAGAGGCCRQAARPRRHAAWSAAVRRWWKEPADTTTRLHRPRSGARAEAEPSAAMSAQRQEMLAASTSLLPLLSPTVFFLTVVSVMNAFQSFGQIHILTKGGPAGSTEVFVYSIYKEAFVNYQFGTGSALALVLFAIILLLTWIQFRFVEKKVHYQ